MGNGGKLEERGLATKLRRKGLSYGEIQLQVPVSKSTLSLWCRNIELTSQQKEKLLKNKQFGQHKGSLIAAENKRKERITRTNEIYAEALKEIGHLSKRERFLIGVSLYAGEGDKSEKGSGFTNSNPLFIKFMMNWFKEFCMIPDAKFRGAIWLHEELDPVAAKRYWSELSGIPQNQFHKTYIAQAKPNSKKIRKNIHKHGIFAIRISDSYKQRKVLGWISAMFGARISAVN